MAIQRFSSCSHQLDKSFLLEHLKGAGSYKRIAGYFTSSLFELANGRKLGFIGSMNEPVVAGNVTTKFSGKMILQKVLPGLKKSLIICRMLLVQWMSLPMLRNKLMVLIYAITRHLHLIKTGEIAPECSHEMIFLN